MCSKSGSSFVDAPWLIHEASSMLSTGTPKHPLIVGGSGVVGSNMLVLLANTPGCERVRVLDLRPPNPMVLADGGISEERIEFVQHRLGSDSEEALTSALEGIDCVFSVVTPPVQGGTAEDFHKTNIVGVESLIKACTAKGVPRLVYLSSIATTNHLVSSLNMSETEPLPPIEGYESAYDFSKRKGEEAVLAANCKDGLKTCALRPGGILTAPNDTIFKNMFLIPGVIFAPPCAKLVDFIDGRDVCRGLLLAAQALGEDRPGVAGEVFFMSKPKGDGATATDIGDICCKFLGWKLLLVPFIVWFIIRWVDETLWAIKKRLGFKVLGLPIHLMIKIALTEQTFDNSKVQKVLGFEPKVTISEATTRICTVYKNTRANAPRPNYTQSHILVILLFVLLPYILSIIPGRLALFI